MNPIEVIRQRLGVRLTAISVLVVGGVMMLSSLIAIQRELRALNQTSDQHARGLAETVATFVAEPLLVQDYPALESYLATLVQENPQVASVRVRRRDGALVATSPDSRAAALETSVGQRVYRADVVLTGIGPRGYIGEVALGVSRAASDSLMRSRMRTVFATTLVTSTALILVLAFLFHRSVVSRVLHLQERASRIGKGDLLSEIRTSEVDEIGQLADALECMRLDLVAAFEERDRTRRDLQSSRDHLSAIFDSAPDGIVVFDESDRIRSVNRGAEALFGRVEDELVGEALSTLIPAATAPLVAENLPPVRGREVEGKRADGSMIPLRLSVGMYSLGGTTMGVAIVSDLSKINDLYESEQSRTFGATAREAAEARAMELFEINERLVETQNQLLQSQKMEAIGQLAGGVAHDFNNLLSIINGQAELLLEGEEACPSSAGLRQILNAGRQAAAVTQQLLAFSRKQVFDTQVVDLNVVIADVERLVSRFIDASIELHVIADSEPRWVEIDVVQLQQIILNLALNARDAMPQGGSLTVEAKRLVPEDRALAIADARRKGAHACLTVSDTGEGMSPHTLAHLFEPFFTTKSLGAGTGLGLSTVHGIVEQSHGFIEVQSELGVGSCISVFLPSAEGPASITDAGREALHTGSDSATEQNDDVRARTEVILLAEDNDEIRRFIAQVLRGRGYLVIESKNGREAAERLAEPGASAIQLVLSDVAMPEMGGRELALHVARVHPSVRVILMSGYAPDAIDGQLRIGSGLGFLQKPFPTRDLLSKIEEYL